VIAEVDDLADDQQAGADGSSFNCSSSEPSVPVIVVCDDSVPAR
jgi:hypothetical protein